MTGSSRSWVLVCVLATMLSGCTRVIDTAVPHPTRQVGPITAAQVGDLHSSHMQNRNGNEFVTAEPQSCAGAGRELRAPFIVDHHPVAIDDGHWDTADPEQYIEEIAAVYPTGFDAKAALDHARTALAACRNTPLTVTSLKGRDYHFTVDPALKSESSNIVLWSLHSADWSCNNAYVAAYNAAIELTLCGPATNYDVSPLARESLKRIELLARNPA